MKQSSIYRSFRYLLIGRKGVGKTNLLTRFLMDQFVDDPNLIFEGQQRVLLTLRQKTFQIILQDCYNQQSIESIPQQVLMLTNGIMFVFSFQVENSFQAIQRQIYLLNKTKLQKQCKLEMVQIMIGNKNENGTPLLEMGDDSGRLSFMDRVSLNDRVRSYCDEMGMRYFQISTKYSSKQQIQRLFIELINQNELKYFSSNEKQSSGNLLSKILPQIPCCSQNNCNIY